jgi:hypothetical protein
VSAHDRPGGTPAFDAGDWHAGPDVVEAYALGILDEARASSMEAHVLRCAGCRSAVAATVAPDRIAGAWAGVEERLDRSELGPIERILVRFGVPDHLARLLAATPSLRLSWFLAVVVALGFAVVAAIGSAGNGGVMVFLMAAPLVPLAGVAAAFGPGVDPTYEVGVAAPLRGHRLLLVRALAVLGTSTLLCGAASLALPGLQWTAGAWLLPAMGLSAATLAVSTVVPPIPAGAIVGGAWIAGVLLAQSVSQTSFAPFRAPGQVLFAAILVVSILVLSARREAFDRKGTP